ncbi:MAG: MoxR family ATPase [Verrucomicrobia bacterium]|nr:MoxR family ATPase [Verrucomicrobiota bacterium]
MAEKLKSHGEGGTAPTSYTETHEVLLKAVRAGRNVLIEGPHGAGKTALVRSVADVAQLDLKYFSASTLDPFADLVGIPVPLLEGESRRVVFLRPEAVNQAQLLFFDELNRAHPRVLNAVFELIQFRSINGELLNRLHSVVAAINPANAGYQVQELDPGLVDRFHLYLPFREGPDRKWFLGEFGDSIGSALLDWYYTDLDAKQRALISNRRLEYIGRCLQDGIDAQFALPPGESLPLASLLARVREDCGLPKIEDFVRDPAQFTEAVARDIRVATRFAQLWPMMSPAQKCHVKELILEIHPEALVAAMANTPFVVEHTVKAIGGREGQEEAAAFKDLLDQRLTRVRPQMQSTNGKPTPGR